jgi:phosphatidate cytidylyltransferase
MPLNLKTFYTRTMTAIVFAAVMLTGLLWNEWAFLVLVAVISTLCLYEYCKIMQQIYKENYWPKWLPIALQAAGLMLIAPVFVFSHLFEAEYPTWMLKIWVLLPSLFITFMLAGAINNKKNYLPAAMQSLAAIFYIALPLALLLHMRLQDMVLPIALIVMIWTNDTMAYLVGSFIGKTPFSPISPKKTWEGTGGGGVLTIIGAGIYGYFSHKYRLVDWLAISFIVSIAGPIGDLFESKLKRMADVKDSGSFMPGHGGALDRFDSLLVATPFVYAYVSLFMRP